MSPLRVIVASPARLATPKSVSLTIAASLSALSGTITLAGLMSRWTTPREWAWPSASQSAEPIRTTSRSDSSSPASRSPRVPPKTSSETRWTDPGSLADS